jgi:hypothetical protein
MFDLVLCYCIDRSGVIVFDLAMNSFIDDFDLVLIKTKKMKIVFKNTLACSCKQKL